MQAISDDENQAGLDEQDESEDKDMLDHIKVLKKFEEIRKEAEKHGTHPHAHAHMHHAQTHARTSRTRPRSDRHVREVALVRQSADEKSVSNSRCMALIRNMCCPSP